MFEWFGLTGTIKIIYSNILAKCWFQFYILIGNGLCGAWHKELNGHDEKERKEIHHSAGLGPHADFVY